MVKQNLVVLDFFSAIVKGYCLENIEDYDTEKIEEFLEEQGHKISYCEYMFGGNLIISL